MKLILYGHVKFQGDSVPACKDKAPLSQEAKFGKFWEILGDQIRKKNLSLMDIFITGSFYLNLILFPGRRRTWRSFRIDFWRFTVKLTLKIIQANVE